SKAAEKGLPLLFTPTLALHSQKTHRHFEIIRRHTTCPPRCREALGAEEIPRREFLGHLTAALILPDRQGHWQFDIP
ncbi:MAG: hypothetical protein AAB308_13485, partial [Nitrospirota bacterium]